jgi:hypothetical protein
VLIEYDITFGKQKVKIKQRVQQTNLSFSASDLPKGQKLLRASYAESLAARNLATGAPGAVGSAIDNPGGTGGVPGTAPATIIGPFVMVCPCEKCAEKDDNQEGE